MQIAVVAALILCNGLLSMSGFAVVSSTRTRLVRMAEDGRAGARTAIGLVDEPNRFFSAVQVGITLVADNASPVSVLIVTGVTTYLTLVIGELVPKPLAIRCPERIAALVVFRLADIRADAVMTPRVDVGWLDAGATAA